MNKIVLSFALLAILQVVLSSTQSTEDMILSRYMDGPRKELFKVYHTVYDKTHRYELNSEEGVRRYRIFNENVKFINEENSKNLPYKLGINQFSDLTNEEYRQKHTLNPKIFSAHVQDMQNESTAFLGETEAYVPGEIQIDHSSILTPVKDQQSCGSCWAFATVGSIEHNYNKKFKEVLTLSSQHSVDCDTSNGGCNGGWPTYAFQFIISKGLPLESSYPYTAKTGTCVANSANNLKIVSGQTQCGISDCSLDKWIALLKNGPIEVAIDAGSSVFQSYKSGVIDPPYVGSNHAVIAYGIGNDTVGDYVMIRNSWGTWWGDKGNVKLRLNQTTKTNGATAQGWWPTVVAKPSPNPNPVPPVPPTPEVNKCPIFYANCGYTGTQLQTCDTKTELVTNKFDWQMSGLKVGNSTAISVFDTKLCKGKSAVITKDNTCFSTDTNAEIKKMSKRVSSFVVHYDGTPPAGCIWVYDELCYGKGREQFCGDAPNLVSFNFNDKISSIRFGPGVKNVVVFLDINYEGLAYGFSKDTGNLDNSLTKTFNNAISSIRIFK